MDSQGEDRYWNEIRPTGVLKEITSANCSIAMTDVAELEAMFEKIKRDVENAVVTFTDRWGSEATVEQVVEFRREYNVDEDAQAESIDFARQQAEDSP